MEIFRTAAQTQAFALAAKKAGKTIALVPTMGFLHDGHMSLIDIAAQKADVVIVSIFVNPTQFAPTEDLDAYPRDFEHDRKLCEAHGVTAIFAPTPEAMYDRDFSVYINEESLSKVLCGKSRPIHFRGVCTVVAKLFNIARADVAIFGRKDAQQALIIKRMVRDLNFPVEIVIAPLVRGEQNLALSSRNKYLSELEKKQALVLSRSVLAAEQLLQQKGRSVIAQLIAETTLAIEQSGGKVDYVECVDTDDLRPVKAETKEVLFAVAAVFGKTRLIDNVMVKLEK